ncbi:MAG: DUF433 domain-containing protein [Acidobacteria bacterium]|nr:DUF433 domain-containing protein [Acidobacteriota bacterium]
MRDLDANALMQRLHSDPDVCGGQMCIKGTRIPVSLILDALAGGDAVEDLLKGYPSLKREDIAAALEYGARLAQERILPLASSS